LILFNLIRDKKRTAKTAFRI